jgi:hypothetical protein
MSLFKVGDRVRVVRSGKEGTITAVGFHLQVEVDGYGSYILNTDRVELIKPKKAEPLPLPG